MVVLLIKWKGRFPNGGDIKVEVFENRIGRSILKISSTWIFHTYSPRFSGPPSDRLVPFNDI